MLPYVSRVLWTGEGWVERERVGRREGGRESGSRGWEGGREGERVGVEGGREGGERDEEREGECALVDSQSDTHTHSPEPQEG